jgi:hypothetical protein
VRTHASDATHAPHVRESTLLVLLINTDIFIEAVAWHVEEYKVMHYGVRGLEGASEHNSHSCVTSQ